MSPVSTTKMQKLSFSQSSDNQCEVTIAQRVASALGPRSHVVLVLTLLITPNTEQALVSPSSHLPLSESCFTFTWSPYLRLLVGRDTSNGTMAQLANEREVTNQESSEDSLPGRMEDRRLLAACVRRMLFWGRQTCAVRRTSLARQTSFCTRAFR